MAQAKVVVEPPPTPPWSDLLRSTPDNNTGDSRQIHGPLKERKASGHARSNKNGCGSTFKCNLDTLTGVEGGLAAGSLVVDVATMGPSGPGGLGGVHLVGLTEVV